MTGRTITTSILVPTPVAPACSSTAVTLYVAWGHAQAVGERGDARPSVLTKGRLSCCSLQRVLLSRPAILLHRRHSGRNDNEEPDHSHVLRAL